MKFIGLILNVGYLSDSEFKYKKNLDLDMNKIRNNGNFLVFFCLVKRDLNRESLYIVFVISVVVCCVMLINIMMKF